MATVTIGTATFITYATLDEANDYMLGSINYPEWEALDEPTMARGLIGATRAIDAITGWDDAHDTFEEREAEPAIVNASIELAYLVATGQAEFLATGSTASGIKRQKAGSVELEYFGGAAGGPDGNGYRFPLNIWNLLRPFLGGAGDESGIGGSISTGTCGRPISEIDYGIAGMGYSDGYDQYRRTFE